MTDHFRHTSNMLGLAVAAWDSMTPLPGED